jgi:DNA-directed RNA polymerase subunit RPC12/RpoP
MSNHVGLPVIEVTDTVIPVGKPKGKVTSLVKTVLYSNGDTVYRCSECEREFPKYISVIGHLKAHRDRKRLRETSEVRKAIEILQKVAEQPTPSEIAKVMRENNSLKTRLRKEQAARRQAEKDLRYLRSFLRQAVEAA